MYQSSRDLIEGHGLGFDVAYLELWSHADHPHRPGATPAALGQDALCFSIS